MHFQKKLRKKELPQLRTETSPVQCIMCWHGQLTIANLAKYYHGYPDAIQSSKTYLDKITKIWWCDKDMGCDRHGDTIKMFIVCINILCWGIQRVVAVANKQKSGIRNRSLDNNRWLQELAHESFHRNLCACKIF